MIYSTELDSGYARTFFNALKEKFAFESHEMKVERNNMENKVLVHRVEEPLWI